MKKILYSIAITVFLSANIHAQTPSVWGVVNNPAGLSSSFSDMMFATDSIGYIFGSFSASSNDMQVTIDSGVDFSPLSLQSNPPLRSPSYGSNMAWPTAQNGYITADTGLAPLNGVFLLSTANGGSSWTASKLESNLKLQNICFPTPNVGYATGTLSDGSADFVAKTTNAGATWDSIYASTNYSFGTIGKLNFIDENNGMFFAQNEDNQLLIFFTKNGGTSFTIRPVPTTSEPNFLHWNKDSSWIVGADSVYRSVDSGQNWTCVIPDTGGGPAAVGAFFGDTGFVFHGIKPLVEMTTNSGISWTQSRLPNAINGSPADSVIPLAASMPSQYDCYLLATDNNSTIDVLMKIAFAKPIDTSGGEGVVQTEATQAIPFAAVFGGNTITFTMAPASEARSMQVLDVLGRECASLAIAPNGTNSLLATSALRPGTYFAVLSGSVVKFAIP
jgi:hypothetical protein